MYIRLVQDFGLECEVAQHLAKAYGDRAFAVAKMAALTGKRWPIIGKKIHPEFPYIDAEVITNFSHKTIILLIFDNSSTFWMTILDSLWMSRVCPDLNRHDC